jgi:hypothetical protein
MEVKGKLKIEQEDAPYIVISTPDYDITMGMLYSTAVNAEANAAELVKRWNGFEGLLAAHRAIMKTADKALRANETSRGIAINEIGNIAEAAIAAANPPEQA